MTRPESDSKLFIALCLFSILLWGWFNALMPMALIIGAILVISQLVSWRWELLDGDFHRVADLSAVIVMISAVYLYSRYSVQGLYEFLRWVPVYFILLMSAQWFSESGRTPMTALVLSLRRSKRPAKYVNVTYAYLLLCLFSAAASEARSPNMYFLVAVVVALLLWSLRPKRYVFFASFSQIMLVIVLGFLGHKAIFYSHQNVSSWVLNWLSQRWHPDESQSVSTSIGGVGRLKLSDQILFRVYSDEKLTSPMLLRQGIYSLYSVARWHSAHSNYKRLDPINKKNWLLQNVASNKNIRISGLAGGSAKKLVPLPSGSSKLVGLETVDLRQNELAVVEIEDSLGFLDFNVSFANANNGKIPHGADLLVPNNYIALMDKIKKQLGLDTISDLGERIQIITNYFAKDFRYSLIQDQDLSNMTPLATFMLKTKKGHCEYYATAGALLLRSVGIPSRYVTGYSVQEYSAWEQAYVVRQRHAHAWIEAYVDGVWTVLDFTPGIWAELEAEQTPWWQPGMDVASRLFYLFNRWRWSDSEDNWVDYGIYAVSILVLILFWRLRNKKRIFRQAKNVDKGGGEKSPSSFVLQIVRALEQKNPRGLGETLLSWLHRCEFDGKEDLLNSVIPLYYQSRYNPKGLSLSKEKELAQVIDSWLKQFMSQSVS